MCVKRCLLASYFPEKYSFFSLLLETTFFLFLSDFSFFLPGNEVASLLGYTVASYGLLEFGTILHYKEQKERRKTQASFSSSLAVAKLVKKHCCQSELTELVVPLGLYSARRREDQGIRFKLVHKDSKGKKRKRHNIFVFFSASSTYTYLPSFTKGYLLMVFS